MKTRRHKKLIFNYFLRIIIVIFIWFQSSTTVPFKETGAIRSNLILLRINEGRNSQIRSNIETDASEYCSWWGSPLLGSTDIGSDANRTCAGINFRYNIRYPKLSFSLRYSWESLKDCSGILKVWEATFFFITNVSSPQPVSSFHW